MEYKEKTGQILVGAFDVSIIYVRIDAMFLASALRMDNTNTWMGGGGKGGRDAGQGCGMVMQGFQGY